MSDVVSALQARLSEIEADADAEDRDFAHTTLLPTYDSDHQHRWNTDDVRRLCRAHRDLIELYQRQHELEASGAGQSTGTQGVLVYAVALLEDVIGALARGLGVEEQSSE